MGLFGSDQDRRWGIAVRDRVNETWTGPPDGIDQAEWEWEGSPPDKQNFLFEYEDDLEPTHEYRCLRLADDDSAQYFEFDEVEWTIEPDEEETEEKKELTRLREELRELREEGQTSDQGLDLTRARDTDEVEAKMIGALAQGAMGQAESIDDYMKVFHGVRELNRAGGSMFDGAGIDSDITLDGIPGLMFLGAAETGQLDKLYEGFGGMMDFIGDLPDVAENVSGIAGALDAGNGGGGSGEDDRIQELEQKLAELSQENQRLREQSLEGESEPAGEEPEPEPEPAETPDTDASEAGFSVDAYTDDGGQAEPTPDGSRPESGAYDSAGDEGAVADDVDEDEPDLVVT